MILTVFLLTASLAVGEVVCRFLPPLIQRYRNSNQKHLDFVDVVFSNGMVMSGFLRPNCDNLLIDGYGKLIRWKNNAFGFRYNKEISLKPDNGVIRTLLLGDSFVVGYRIDQKAMFSVLLENYFNNKKDGKKYEILPADIDEPYFGLRYLSNFGIKFEPSIVILGITLGNDLFQNYAVTRENIGYILHPSTRHFFAPGNNYVISEEITIIPSKYLVPKRIKIEDNVSIFNRFMLYRTLLGWSKKYQGEEICSYFEDNQPRLHEVCVGYGIHLKESPEEINESYKKFFETLSSYKELSERYRFKLIVVIFPQRFQVQKEDWTATVNGCGLNKDCFDLMKPNNLILDYCKKAGIVCLDPTSQMTAIYEKKGRSLYFPLRDMHWNSSGHRALFDSVKERVYEIISSGQ